MKVEYKIDHVEITTELCSYRIDKLSQMYSICEQLKLMVSESSDERKHRALNLVLDALNSARDKMIQYQETRTCPYPIFPYPQVETFCLYKP